MAVAQSAVRRIREAGRALAFGPSPPWSATLRERFFAALADDFNTPAALAVVFEWAREANRARAGAPAAQVGDADFREMLAVLALDNVLEQTKPRPPADVLELLQSRELARQDGNYKEADSIRERIEAMGWEVRDGPSGPELLPAKR